MGGVSGFEFEDLAPSCGTGADGDFVNAEICSICLFPGPACICKRETCFQFSAANTGTFTKRNNSGTSAADSRAISKKAKNR